MTRSNLSAALLLVAAAIPASAHAASQPPETAPTGSPTNATATVSPATVAEAAIRADQGPASGGKASQLGFSIGTSIAGGDFGSGQDSRLWSSAFGARYAMGALRLTASIPYLEIRSRGLIFSGVDGTPVIVAGGTRGPRATYRGLGDATVGAAYTIGAGQGRPEIELSGRIKLPTATRSSQLSTGKTDYSAGVQITQPIGIFAPFISGTYRAFGDPAIINLRNGFAASTGTSIALGGSTVALVSYHYARAASTLVRDSHEMFAGGSTRIAGTPLRATAFVTAGLSSGAARTSGGLSLAVGF